MKYLVINNSKSQLLSFAEQYQLFDDRDKAIKCFVDFGGEECAWGMSLSNKPGVASIQKGGEADLDLTFMPILTQ